MNLGQAVAAALPELRRHAESMMRDVCTIDRKTSRFDEEQQKSVSKWEPVHEDVRCAVDDPQVKNRATVTDEAVTPQRPVVKVSVDVTGVQPNDRVTVAGFGVMWVTHVPQRTDQVVRRIECRWNQ